MKKRGEGKRAGKHSEASAVAELVLQFRIMRMSKWVGRISAVLVPMVTIISFFFWRRP